MTDFVIEDYIPKGYANRISRPQLQIITGLKDRVIRREIEEARDRGVFIISADGGYFLYKDAKDDAHAQAYIMKEERRFKTISHQNKQLRRAWKRIKPENDNRQVPGQMSFLR